MRRVGDAPCVFSCQVLKRPLRKSNEEKTTPVGCLFLLFFFFSFEKIRRPLLSLKNWSFWFFLFFKKFFRETFLIGKLDEKELRKKKFNIIGIVYIVSLIRTSYIIQVKKSTRVEIGDMQLRRLSIVNYVMDWRRRDVLQTRYLRSLQFSVSVRSRPLICKLYTIIDNMQHALLYRNNYYGTTSRTCRIILQLLIDIQIKIYE